MSDTQQPIFTNLTGKVFTVQTKALSRRNGINCWCWMEVARFATKAEANSAMTVRAAADRNGHDYRIAAKVVA
jgi:hypothetical protein